MVGSLVGVWLEKEVIAFVEMSVSQVVWDPVQRIEEDRIQLLVALQLSKIK